LRERCIGKFLQCVLGVSTGRTFIGVDGHVREKIGTLND
jgi:hypothetical protein